jgi:hypothetical protein
VPYHPADQAPGTTDDQVRLIDAALAASPGGSRAWGICTECGMGRVERAETPGLLEPDTITFSAALRLPLMPRLIAADRPAGWHCNGRTGRHYRSGREALSPP